MSLAGVARLISIVRRPREIVACISEPVPAIEPPALFEIHSIPLDRLKRSLYPRKEKLQESWRYLARVKSADEDTLYHALLVVMESVPDLSVDTTPPPLPPEWSGAPFSARASSAHPRAYKGTKYQPPKGRRLAPIDVRPYLCHARSI